MSALQNTEPVTARDAAIRAEVLKEVGWRSVKDRFPEIGQVCLVANETEILGFSQWGSKEIPFPGWVFPKAPMYTEWIGQDITHWMPLPEPPIMGEAKEGQG